MKTNQLLSLRRLSPIVLLLFVCSCSSLMTGVRRDDFLNRFTKTEIEALNNWKFGDDRLVLRRNNTFRYSVNTFGITTEYFAGSYERFNDTIVLSFHKNRYPFVLNQSTDKLTISLNEVTKPGFFKKSDTLLLATKTSCNGTQQILKNTSGDYFVVVSNKQTALK